MQRVAAIFATELDDVIKPFHVQRQDNKAIGTTIYEALQHQKAIAESIRQQQDTEEPNEVIEASEKVELLTEEAAALLKRIPTDIAAAGRFLAGLGRMAFSRFDLAKDGLPEGPLNCKHHLA